MGDISNWRKDSVLYKYYVEKEWSATRIAQEADVPEALVRDYIENRDLEEKKAESKSKTCPDCGEEFESVDDWAEHHQSEHYTWEVHRVNDL